MGKQITGAEIVMESLKHAGCDIIFGIPGGVVIPIYDALLDAGIRFVLTRHEQGATHMADGYARATGRPAVVLVTSGPGATNTITGIATAHMDSVPMVVVTGQVRRDLIGKDAFQEADVTGITLPIVKHSYLVTDIQELPLVIKQAFHIATTGRPGPVLVDVPVDISKSRAEFMWPEDLALPHYRTPGKGDPKAIQDAADLIARSQRPILYVGGGAIISGAYQEVMELAEKLRAPVTTTLLGKGAFPETHPLSVGMLGMHGTAYANKCMVETDLMIAIGARWDDRITGKLEEFGVTAKKIHIDIDPTECGKTVKPDVFILGDARLVLKDLNSIVQAPNTETWLRTVGEWKQKYPLKIPRIRGVSAQSVIRALYETTKGQDILVTDVGQHQMWCAQFYQTSRPRQWLSSGGAGTMGFGLPAAIGAQIGRPEERVWAVVGDGGFQMNIQELATAAVNHLPIKVLIMNNHYLGMVRQWQDMFWKKRYSGVVLDGNPDFAKVAEAYGIKGIRVRTPRQVQPALDEALNTTDGPVILDVETAREENVFPMIPGGAALSDMIIEPPDFDGEPI